MKVRLVVSTVAMMMFAALIPHAAGASATQVASPVDVTKDLFADNEESLGMSPNGLLLAGAWNDWDYNDGCGFSYSTNGGASWAPRSFVPEFTAFTNDPSIPGTGPYGVAGDPAVAYNPKFGVFDVVCQAFGGTSSAVNLLATTFDPSKANPNLDENLSYGAAAWTHPTSVATGKSNGAQKGHNGQFPDHESITLDTSNAPGHHFGRIYVTWAQFSGNGRSPIQVASSDDNGKTWMGPITVSDKANPDDQDARVEVAPNGTLYDVFVGGPNETSLKNNFVGVARSTNGGLSWGATHKAAKIVTPIAGLLPNSSYRVFSDVSAAVDQVNGRLVIAYNDAKSGASQIFTVHQFAAGDVSDWSAPVRIKSSHEEQYFPWMSAAPDGRVDLVYYDRTCDPNDTLNCVTLSSSWNAGSSWSSVALLSKGFDGDKFQACLAFVQTSDCGVFFLGDYIAVASTNTTAVSLFTGNGSKAMDVFSMGAKFPSD